MGGLRGTVPVNGRQNEGGERGGTVAKVGGLRGTVPVNCRQNEGGKRGGTVAKVGGLRGTVPINCRQLRKRRDGRNGTPTKRQVSKRQV